MMTISPSVPLYISTSYVEVENFKHLLTSPYFYHHMNTLDNYFATTRSIRKFKFDTTESMSAFSYGYATKMCRRQGGRGRGKERGRNEILLKVPLKRCHYASGFLRSNNSLIWRVSKIYWSSYPNPSYPFFRAFVLFSFGSCINTYPRSEREH